MQRGPNLPDIARQTAPKLGTGWHATDDTAGAILTGPAGERLWLCHSRQGVNSIHIRGTLPQTTLRVANSAINVGAWRGPRIIAGEIQRRLLPGYREALARVQAGIADEQHNAGVRDALLKKIADMFGSGSFVRHTPRGYGRPADPETIIRAGHRFPGSGHVSTHGDGSTVTLELRSVPADTALRALAAMLNHATPPRT